MSDEIPYPDYDDIPQPEPPRLKTSWLSDIPEPDESMRLASESSFRRGYCQGFHKAIEVMRLGGNVHEHLDKLIEWRSRVCEGTFELPPNMD